MHLAGTRGLHLQKVVEVVVVMMQCLAQTEGYCLRIRQVVAKAVVLEVVLEEAVVLVLEVEGGVMVVVRVVDGQCWMLTVEQLPPVPAGPCYQLLQLAVEVVVDVEESFCLELIEG